uniref:DUF4283 domain-containing protein n=1 Tax=Opuntia streptacantha TaxID=393608 RepID=A0A7C9F5N3_OPUST
MGDSSNPSHEIPSVNHSQPKHSSAINIDEFSAMCLLGKVWGEAITLSAIIHRTRNDWKFTKGQIEYVDLGNEWVLIRFATSQDRDLVFSQRPWYVNGLNFVIIPWIPLFDPYNSQISRVDQWVRIPRLPWEFWEADYLGDPYKSQISMFILCWLTSSHLSGHDVDSLDISNVLALLVFRCCEFVFFIIHVPIAVWSDFPLFFRCNYHPRLLGCSSEKETHSRWAFLEQYQKLTDGWRIISKNKAIGTQCVNSHLASISGVAFVIIFIFWMDLSFFTVVVMKVQLCLMASEHYGFYELDGCSKAFSPTAFGLRFYDTGDHPMSEIYCDKSRLVMRQFYRNDTQV